MCTAISYKTKHHYFGRNLDLDCSYKETVTTTPRNYPFVYRYADTQTAHFAMIGMATVFDGYPLYYEATNEYGLSMSGLNFPGNAVYLPYKEGMNNITPFEFIPWILSQCKTVAQAEDMLKNLNLVDTSFSTELPLSPLHWMICDRDRSIIVEPGNDGLAVYKNPVGVLTNNPPFPFHLYHLNSYLNLTPEEPVNRFSSQVELAPYSRGMGGIGLPGDLSSPSRFVRATFTKLNSVAEDTEESSVSQFFHILNSVAHPRGCARMGEHFEITVYSCCCNTDTCTYYYTTYENSQINAVELFKTDLSGTQVVVFPVITTQQINRLN